MKLILKKIKALSLEEKILNGGYLLSIIGFFMPWISGTSLTNEEFAFNGFSYYISFIGFTAAVLLIFCLAITLVPLLYNQKLIQDNHKSYIRYHCTALSTILILSCLSVLTKISWETTKLHIRAGIYISIIGALVSTVYTYALWKNKLVTKKSTENNNPNVQDDQMRQSTIVIPNAPEAEPHKLFR